MALGACVSSFVRVKKTGKSIAIVRFGVYLSVKM
jgi:hypothetical protein